MNIRQVLVCFASAILASLVVAPISGWAMAKIMHQERHEWRRAQAKAVFEGYQYRLNRPKFPSSRCHLRSPHQRPAPQPEEKADKNLHIIEV